MGLETKGKRREALVARVQAYFLEERGEQLGNLGADTLLDWIEADLAPVYYNLGVADAQVLMQQRLASASEDLEALERVLPPDLRPPTGPE